MPVFFRAVEGGERAHLLSAVAGLIGGDALLTYAQLVYHGVLRPRAAGRLGYLLGRHKSVGQINPESNYAHRYIVHIVSLSVSFICEHSFTLS